uniref:Carboxylic ester hydrolase n=1 Tax=Graphocephala atropunctata TaxID=36148 RepID=A0A1B6LGE3_9HEMI
MLKPWKLELLKEEMAEEKVIIHTKLGQLRGLVKHSVLTEKSYYSFRGIPYGKPPLGELRFKAPQPFGSWEGIRDALEDGNVPIQPHLIPQPGVETVSDGDEDCLCLNVYINELPDEKRPKKPVIVSIHGGGFIGGSGSSKANGPDNFMYGDLVVVSFNYRCGAFGFLSLENEEVPGNAGLKDQTLALKWVRDNIDSFGGDPNNVTIFGISAGGASVGYQLISPSSKGLFHKAILQSGFALNPWALQVNPREQAIKLAKTLGCASEEPEEVLRFLQSVPAVDIVVATKKLSTAKASSMRTLTLMFTPCVEVSGPEPFLSDVPHKIMESGLFNDVPVIMGCTVKEGSVAALFDGVSDKAFENLNNNPEWLVPQFLGLKPGSVEEKEATKAIWDFYLKGKPVSWDNVNEFLLCVSDIQFTVGMEQTRVHLVEKASAPVYSYLFTNHSRCLCGIIQNIFEGNASKIITAETCHAADCFYMYVFDYGSIKTPEYTPTDVEAIKRHIKAWTVFASTGNPNNKELGVTWEQDSKANPCFMDIGETWSMREGTILPDRIGFWMELISKYCSS